MAYFLLKTNDKKQVEDLNFSKSISWKQYHSKFKPDDVVFIYLISEKKFDCAAEIVDIEEKNKKCYLIKLFDIKNSSIIISNKSKFSAMKSRCSNILLKEKNQELTRLLLENKV